MGGAQEAHQEGTPEETYMEVEPGQRGLPGEGTGVSGGKLPLSVLFGSKVQESGRKLGEAIGWLWRRQDKRLHEAPDETGPSKVPGSMDPESIEGDFLSSTAQSATTSRQKTVRAIMAELAPTQPWSFLKVSPMHLKAVGTVLKAAEYRAAPIYLHDLKSRHVENGHAWNDALDLTFKRVKRALSRDAGPRNKAAEVSEAEPWPRVPVTGIKYAHELFLFAVVWMLRAYELTGIQISHVQVKQDARTVSLEWKKSKGGQRASGCTTRQCEHLCPFGVCCALLDKLLTTYPAATHVAWGGL